MPLPYIKYYQIILFVAPLHNIHNIHLRSADLCKQYDVIPKQMDIVWRFYLPCCSHDTLANSMPRPTIGRYKRALVRNDQNIMAKSAIIAHTVSALNALNTDGGERTRTYAQKPKMCWRLL